MFGILRSTLRYILVEGDNRTFPLFLSNPLWPLYTFFFYVFLVKVVGPKFMKNRKPFELKNVMLFYNATQVILSGYMFLLFCQHGWLSISNWYKCKPIEESNTAEFKKILYVHHLYYISKFIELLDTVFFVLRKKFNQASFLHIYHHGTMPFFTCLTMRFSPGGSVSFIGFLNTFVHIIMYGYYMLAALGPKVQKFLWWKKYITSLQLAQFVTLFFHFIIVLFSTCNVPKGMSIFLSSNILFNFALFYHFYRKEYKQKLKAKAQKQQTTKISCESNENGYIETKSKFNGFSNNSLPENIRNRAYS